MTGLVPALPNPDRRVCLHNPETSPVLIDSHCHLDYYTPAELPAVLSRAAAAGVSEMVTIGTTMEQAAKVLKLVETHPNVWGTVGVHPHHAAEAPIPDPTTLAGLAEHPKIIGIGESGLDYFYDRAPRDVQQRNFRAHIQAARLTGLPLAIHARDADDDIIKILQEEQDAGGSFAFLLHCFSSSRQLAEFGINMGGYVSFSGILTFPKSNDLRQIAADLPPERLLVETDAPYLAPVPVRGKRNEPAHVTHTAAVLAGIRGLTTKDLAELTTANFLRLFKKAD